MGALGKRGFEFGKLSVKLFNSARHRLVPAHKSGLGLKLCHRALCLFEGVMHVLTARSPLRGNLSEAEVIVIVEVKGIALLFGEQLAVKIIEKRFLQRTVRHFAASLCKALLLDTTRV